MKVFALGKLLSNPGRIGFFHSVMFHGIQERAGGIIADVKASHFQGGDLSEPLALSRNGWRVPDIFMPGLSLVVSSDVRAKLASIQHVQYLPVTFKKLVHLPFEAGDFSFRDKKQYPDISDPDDPEPLLMRMPDIPWLHERVGDYFEVVLQKLHPVAQGFKPLQKCRISDDIYPGDNASNEVLLSVTLIEEYSLAWWYSILLHERVFDLLEPYIDWEYFFISEIKL